MEDQDEWGCFAGVVGGRHVYVVSMHITVGSIAAELYTASTSNDLGVQGRTTARTSVQSVGYRCWVGGYGNVDGGSVTA